MPGPDGPFAFCGNPSPLVYLNRTVKMRIAALIATVTFLGVTPVQASMKAAAKVTAAKGPVQITLRLHKTKVKVKKSLWYKLELKNIGKKKILVHDRFYKDPWALHENCRSGVGLYLEILDPSGKPLSVQRGGGQEKYDWEPEPGGTLHLTEEESKEFHSLEAKWKQRGLTAQQRSIATSRWSSELADRKTMAERSDPAKQFWLKPGASTATFAWAYRETVQDEYTDHSGEEPQIGDYTQLWSYEFFHPGKYRIRAVFNQEQSESTRRLFKKHGHTPEPTWIEFKTPFIEFQVLP